MEIYISDDLDVYEVVDLGQAVGTAYGSASLLLTGRDGLHLSRMTKRGLILGIAYTGASVLDLRLVPKLVLEDSLERQGDAALYVDYRPSQIRIGLEGEGVEEKAGEVHKVRKSRKFVRAPLSDLGAIALYPNAIDDYVSGLHKRVDYLKDVSVLVDCQNGPITVLMAPLLESYGMKVELFNDRATQFQEPLGKEAFRKRLSSGRYDSGIRCLDEGFELHTGLGDLNTYRDLPGLVKALEG